MLSLLLEVSFVSPKPCGTDDWQVHIHTELHRWKTHLSVPGQRWWKCKKPKNVFHSVPLLPELLWYLLKNSLHCSRGSLFFWIIAQFCDPHGRKSLDLGVFRCFLNSWGQTSDGLESGRLRFQFSTCPWTGPCFWRRSHLSLFTRRRAGQLAHVFLHEMGLLLEKVSSEGNFWVQFVPSDPVWTAVTSVHQ